MWLKFYTKTGPGLKKYCAIFQTVCIFSFGAFGANKVTFCGSGVECSVRGRSTKLPSYIKLSEFRRIWPSLNMNCFYFYNLQTGKINSFVVAIK